MVLCGQKGRLLPFPSFDGDTLILYFYRRHLPSPFLYALMEEWLPVHVVSG